MSLLAEDRDLLLRFRKGEPAALEAVYRHYVDDVGVLARRGFTMESQGHLYVPGPADAEGQMELVQETFLRAFAEKARNSYDGLRPYRPYLLRITKNLMVDRMRRLTRDRKRLQHEDSVGDIDDLLARNGAFAENNTVETQHWQTLREHTRAYVQGLDEELQSLVRLRFEEARSQEEVAQGLGCTRRRVRTVEARVLRGLSKYLKKHGVSEV